MSRILQKLVSQAQGRTEGGSQIRSAAVVHAQVPIGLGALSVPDAPGQHPAPAPDIPHSIYKSEPDAPATGRVAAALTAPEVVGSAPIRPQKGHAEPAAMPSPASTQPEMRPAERQVLLPLLTEAPPPIVAPDVSPVFTNAATRLHPAPAPRRDPSAQERTEVQVHIGRIEVIGAPDPAPVRKATKPAVRPTIPLADYLAKKARP